MKITQRWQFVALILIVCMALYVLGPVLTPFAAAAIFAYLFDPLVDRLQRWKLSRSWATTIVFLVLLIALIVVLVLLVPYIERQIATLIRKLPDWIAWIQSDGIPWLNAQFDLSLEAPDMQQLAGILQEHWKEAGGAAATIALAVSKSGLTVVSWVIHLIVVPVAFFYLLRDWHSMIEGVHDLIPRAVEPTVVRLARESDETLSGFVRGQVTVMLALGVIYAIALWAIGLDIGPLIGIIAGVISFIPYLGGISGILMALIAAIVQYHDWMHVILVLVVYGVGQVMESGVLTPKLVGDRIGLHPLAVIFAILAGGELFGFIGVLLALPIASVCMVVLRELHRRYRASDLYRHGREQTIVLPGDAIVIVDKIEPPTHP